MTTPASKRTTSPAFQFYPRDFLSSSKVDQMSMTERGVYITLLSRCWLDNGLPIETKELAGLVRMKPQQFARLWSSGQVGKCFTARDGKYHNDRLDDERQKQADYRRRQSDKGKASAAGRLNRGATGEQPALNRGSTKTLPTAVQPKGNSASVSASASASTPPNGGVAPPRPMAPIHDASHKKHAICGRVCLYASQFNEFVRRRNHDNADTEVRQWAAGVVDAWTSGAFATVEPGDSLDFWKARYAEQWPAAAIGPVKPMPEWYRRSQAAKAVQ